jgi:hypothetical protein
MVIRRVYFFIVAIYCILIFGQSIAQEKDGEGNPISLDKYNISQYISTIGASPQNIISLDNNGDILLACISGKTIDQIKSMEIDFTSSQIRILKDWRLLKEENKILRTTFPIINADKTKKLRSHSKKISSYLGQNLQDDIIHLTKELKSLQREKNIYSILFSYVIDGLVWDRFIEKEILKERKITVKEPFWNGVIWAVYPPRDFFCGTNSISDQGVSLNVNWSEKTIKKMIPFVADWKNLGKMFDDFLKKGKVEDENAKKVFSPFNLFNSSGQFTIPIIEEKKGNTLYEICFLISEKIAKEVPELLNLSELKEAFDFHNEEQTLVIIYHELMWDLLDYFEEQNLIQKPIAFANPDKAESKDIADLVFFVKRNESR